MRFITVPEPFIVRDQHTERPVRPGPGGVMVFVEERDAERIPFGDTVVQLCKAASQDGQSDTLTLIDIRTKARTLKPGELWECPDDWHAILERHARTLRGWLPELTLSAGTHLRTIREAPTKPPVTAAPKKKAP